MPDTNTTAYQNLRVAVTGGAGFIGSHLVDALVAAGARVNVIDDLSNGRRSNLAHHLKGESNGAVGLVVASILDAEAVRDVCADCDLVFHQAAMTSVPRSVAEPQQSLAINAAGTLNVLDAARLAGARRVVLASSSSVYGEQPEPVKVESMPLRPLSPYAAGKCAAEYLARSWAHCFGLSTVCLRYFNIFGARQRADSPYAAVIPRFAETMRAGEIITVFGDGEQTRDFTHVSNAVHANLLAGVSDHQFRGDAFNIACGSGTSVNRLIKELEALLNVVACVEHAPARPGEVLHSTADISRARRQLEYHVQSDFVAGLRCTLT